MREYLQSLALRDIVSRQLCSECEALNSSMETVKRFLAQVSRSYWTEEAKKSIFTMQFYDLFAESLLSLHCIQENTKEF